MKLRVQLSAGLIALSLLPIMGMAKVMPRASTTPMERASTTQKLKDLRQEKKDFLKENRDERREVKKEIRDNSLTRRLERYSAPYTKILGQKIKQLKNVVTRLEGEKSIIAKLDSAGKDTSAIKTKIADIKVLITKAESDLASTTANIKSLIADSDRASTTPALNKVKQIKAIFSNITGEIKVIQTKLNEVMKALKEIRGIGAINSGSVGTTTATSTTN